MCPAALVIPCGLASKARHWLAIASGVGVGEPASDDSSGNDGQSLSSKNSSKRESLSERAAGITHIAGELSVRFGMWPPSLSIKGCPKGGKSSGGAGPGVSPLTESSNTADSWSSASGRDHIQRTD